VLKAIVEEHVETAQPVGSQTIAKSRELGVSSATVRNDMTQLEREGYIVQPHTSAGRVPTDLGYRYFVDHFASGRSTLAPNQRRAVTEFFASAHSALEDLLNETSQLLAGLTRHAAMIVGPGPESTELRAVHLVPLQGGHVLAVAVLSNGAVEKDVLLLNEEPDEETVHRATEAIDSAVRGYAPGQAPPPAATGIAEVDRLAKLAHDALRQRASAAHESLYVGGVSRIAAEQEFATAASAARLLEMLEQQVVVVSLVRNVLDEGVTVRIGAGNRVEELRDCSLVLAPYSVEGQVAGTVGVLGPTRMDYQQALAAVAAVSHQLGRLLSP
jgi:heat-inducible transcriptional repressor